MFPSVLVAGTQGLTPLQLGGSSEPGTPQSPESQPALLCSSGLCSVT